MTPDTESVFACGGDGTISDVAASLAGTDVSLGIIPAGTTNVLAHEFGLPGDAYKRSEEHTSELHSLRHLVCRLLLEKKKTTHAPRASSGRCRTTASHSHSADTQPTALP